VLVSGNFLKAVNGKNIRLLLIKQAEETKQRDFRLTFNGLSFHPDKGIHRTAGT